MKRVSCIDVGTNTALLLIADLEPESGSIISVLNRQTIVRLGEKVDRRKRIEQEALDRLLVCMREYRSISESFRVDQIIAGGTSALRDASNCTEVVETIARETGIVIGCISGSREAELTFFGAVAGLDNLPEPFAVIDIGGGSTEISMGSFDGIEERVSMDIGSVRLTERHFGSNPPSLREFDAARQEINRTIAASVIPFFPAREAVYGVAGTLTTIAQVSQGLRNFDAEKVQNCRLTYSEVHRLLETFRSCSLEELVALGIAEGRADVITMGTLILHQFMRLLGVGSLRVSIQGLRFGLAREALLDLP